jgi:hypothetical protein
MPDEKLRLVSLTVLGGALDGRRHDPDEVVTEILIGSDPDCHLVVDLPGVSPIHARVWADLDESLAYDTRAPRGLYVNATRVEGQARIGAGDVLWLGPPQEPDSVCIECRFEPWVEVLPASLVDEAPAGESPVEAAPVETPVDVAEAVVLEDAPPTAVEDDPFFVGEGSEPSLAPQYRPATVADEFLVEETAVESAAPPEPSPVAPPAEPPLSPEALVAETIAEPGEDDWAIADAGGPAAPGPAATAPAAPPPAAEPPSADDFFVAEDEAVFVDAEPAPSEPPRTPAAPLGLPALDLPPLDLPPLAAPAAEPPVARAPQPPKLVATPPPAPAAPAPPVAVTAPPTPVAPPPAPQPPLQAAFFVPEGHLAPESVRAPEPAVVAPPPPPPAPPAPPPAPPLSLSSPA